MSAQEMEHQKQTHVVMRAIWATFAVVSLSLGAGGYAYYRKEVSEIRKERYDDLNAIASLKQAQIVQWRSTWLKSARIVAQEPWLHTAVGQWLSDAADTELKGAILDRLQSVKAEFACERIFLLTVPDGKPLLATEGRDVHQPAPSSAFVAQAVSKGDAVFSNLFRCQYCTLVHLDVAAPIRDDSGRIIAEMVMRIDPYQILYPLVTEWPTPSPSAETLLIRKDGNDVLFLNELRHETNTALRMRIPLTATNVPAVMAVQGASGIFDGLDYRGKRVVSDIRAIPGTPWFMVAKVDYSEIMAEAGYRAGMVAVLAAMGIGFSGLAAMAATVRARKNLYKRLFSAEKDRADAQEEIRATLYGIGDGVIATDKAGRVRRINPVAQQLTGWSEQDARNRPIQEVFKICNEYSRDVVVNPVDIVLEKGMIVGLANHTLLIARDGTERPIADSAAPIHGTDGTIIGVVLVFRDQTEERAAHARLEARHREVTKLLEIAEQSRRVLLSMVEDRQLAEKKLRESEERFSLAANAAGIGVWEFDVANGTLSWDERMHRLHGVSPQTFDGTYEAVQNLVHPDDRYRVVQVMEAAARNGTLFNAEYRSVWPDDSIRHLKAVGKMVGGPNDDCRRMIGVSYDITEETHHLEQLKRLSAAIKQAAEIVVVTAPDGTIEYVNPAFEVATGYLCAEAIGQNPRLLRSGVQPDAVYAEMWRTITSGKTWSGRFVNRRKDGSFYNEEATISPVKNDDGTIANYVAVKRDITAELARERQYRQEQKMGSVGRLAGGIAHDFNNILQSIIGFCGLLLDSMNGCVAAKCIGHRTDVEGILKAARHAADLTRQLLAFSREQPIHFSEQDVNAIIKDQRSMLDRILGDTIRLEYAIDSSPAMVLADASQILQVVMNLVVNARDAMPSGGLLRIETRNVALDADEIRLHPDAVSTGAFVRLSVADNGIGMSKETSEHIFDPFFTTKQPGKGTGLGLSVVYGIVRDHGGWIEVESSPGKGTEFRIYLPRCGASRAIADRPEGEIERRKVGGNRILLVEDDPVVCGMTREILENAGYEVQSADSAEQALLLLERDPAAINLLYSDIMLPGQSGVALADAARKLRRDLPILLYSGSPDCGEQIELIGGKGYAYMRKPFSALGLIDAVRQTMECRILPPTADGSETGDQQ